MATEKNKDFLYEQIAATIEGGIENGSLGTGHKLKSVRVLSKELGVSQSTVFNAYYDLESKGLVESRPKSGYYVKFVPSATIKKPKLEWHQMHVKPVNNWEIISKVISRRPEQVLELANASPHPSMLPVSKIRKSIQRASQHDAACGTSYEDFKGNEELRKHIGRLSHNWGRHFHERDILVTNGCMEALSLSLKAVTKEGDTVAIESPTYFGIFQLLESLGLNVVEIPACPDEGISASALEAAIIEHQVNAVLLVPNFNNPSGSLMPERVKEQIARIVSRYKIPLIEDDVYGELYYGAHRPKTIKSFDEEGWVIYCASFSKNLAPGFRIGWCIAGKFQEAILHQKFISSITCPSITQYALCHLLEKGRYDLHLKRLRKVLHVQSLQYTKVIADSFPQGTKITRPQGGFVLWIELPDWADAFALYKRAMHENISISPGHIFSNNENFRHFIRISYAQPFTKRIEFGLKRLGWLVQDMLQTAGVR